RSDQERQRGARGDDQQRGGGGKAGLSAGDDVQAKASDEAARIGMPHSSIDGRNGKREPDGTGQGTGTMFEATGRNDPRSRIGAGSERAQACDSRAMSVCAPMTGAVEVFSSRSVTLERRMSQNTRNACTSPVDGRRRDGIGSPSIRPSRLPTKCSV